MPVNESDDALMLFSRQHKPKFIDESDTISRIEPLKPITQDKLITVIEEETNLINQTEWDDDDKQSSCVLPDNRSTTYLKKVISFAF